MQESSAFMAKAFTIAIFLVALVLVTQFDSVLTPFIIMTSVILSFIGIFLGLLVTQTSFGIIMTGMGVISLTGVVVNNAIVLIDYINVLRKRGKSFIEAIITAGCTRFRPVLLTAITTVFGLIPMAIGVSLEVHNLGAVVSSLNLRKLLIIGSDMSQFWSAMAIAVIFGLVVATVLTLFVVPCFYSLLFYRKKKQSKVSEPLEELETSLESVVYSNP
jgi:multidrug efflux pump subunit AcrB